jgi:glyoxylase-like metal-dependent hydrolase (beta-lactamase superfamily II)
MAIPLEDKFNDIVGKAMRGFKISDSDVATAAGIFPGEVKSLRDGAWDKSVALRVASALGLKAQALVESGHESWQPAPVKLDGFAQFNTPYEDMTVNSYLAWDAANGAAVAFDTGADCSDMLALIAEKKLTLKYILLTHTHGDHIFDLDRLKEKTGAPAFVGEREPIDGAETFPAGSRFEVGALRIETRLTWGHSKGGITYLLSGLAQPVAIVGDAVFAGSMGGGAVSYAAALCTNREHILSRPDNTIIASGHGPLTTVGEEKIHNPFFP